MVLESGYSIMNRKRAICLDLNDSFSCNELSKIFEAKMDFRKRKIVQMA